MVFKHCSGIMSQKFLLLFYIFTSTLNSFVWSVLADYLLHLNTKFCFIFESSAEFITLSLGKKPLHHYLPHLPISPLTFSVLSQYSMVQSFLLTVHTLFISYSPLPSSLNISLWIPVTLPSHPSFFFMPAGVWLFFFTCSVMKLFPPYFMKITSESSSSFHLIFQILSGKGKSRKKKSDYNLKLLLTIKSLTFFKNSPFKDLCKLLPIITACSLSWIITPVDRVPAKKSVT